MKKVMLATVLLASACIATIGSTSQIAFYNMPEPDFTPGKNVAFYNMPEPDFTPGKNVVFYNMPEPDFSPIKQA